MGASGRTHASENERSQTCIQVTMLPLANCAISLREKYENVSGFDKLTFLPFDTSLNHGVGGRGSLKNFLQALSLPSLP